MSVVEKRDNVSSFDASCDQINDYFCANFTNDSSLIPAFPSNEEGFSFSPTNDLETSIAIHSIKSDAIGLDNLPLKFLKHILPFIIQQITYIFNLIIRTGKFPTVWKETKIIPIKKNKRINDINNLRPISILCGLSKAFEKILKTQIQSYLSGFDLLSPFQSGFRAGHSTTSALLKVHDDIHKFVDKRGLAILMLIDFSKAFDRVSHCKLLKKLSSSFYFSSQAVNTIKSYLCHRKQVVYANNSFSKSSFIISGVPQGSVLGPLLFTMFINDLPSILKHCQIHMFADDVQLYLCSDSLNLNEIARLVNLDLARLLHWSEKNLLQINGSKTKAILFTRNTRPIVLPSIYLGSEQIEFLEKVNNLGVVFQNNLEWDDHINAQCGKVYAGLRRLRLTASMLPCNVKLMLFKSLLLPHFMYGLELVMNASARSLDRLRVALNCCVRWVFNLNRYSHVTRLQSKLLGCSFYQFFKLRSCFMVFKIINCTSPQYLKDKLQPFRSNRNRNFVLPTHDTSHYGGTFFIRSVIYWNQLPSLIKNINSYRSFRQECTEWLNGGNQQM